MRLADPYFLFIGLILLGLIYWFIHHYKKSDYNPALRFSRLWLMDKQKTSLKVWGIWALKWLKYLALILLLIALSRPQKGRTFETSNDQGIDIMIAMDTSSSMQSVDFRPNRLEAAKKVTEDFIKARKFDRIGLVNFSGLAFTQSPLTTDKDSLVEFIRGINIGDTGLDGTAIGSAIMTSLTRLKDSKAKTKLLILVTDGNNNMGEIDPITASQIAAQYDVKIYAIAVGSLEGAIYVVNDPIFGQRELRNPEDKINESALKQVAANTEGEYFRASDRRSFEDIMKRIDNLEKDDIKITLWTRYNELYKSFALWAFIIMFLIVLLENTIFRKLP